MQIVTVTEQNRSLFEQMVPEEFFDPLDRAGHFVLGAIGEDEEGRYAAGVLCFQVEVGSAGDEDMLVGILQWLYVGIAFLRTFPYDAKHMMDLIYFVSAKIRNKYSPDTQLRFTVRNQTTAAIVSRILPNAEPLLVYRGVSLTMEEELPYAN